METSNYILIENICTTGNSTYISYGIALAEIYDGTLCILQSIPDLSTNKQRVESLVHICNTLQLVPIHLPDVIEDFLAI